MRMTASICSHPYFFIGAKPASLRKVPDPGGPLMRTGAKPSR